MKEHTDLSIIYSKGSYKVHVIRDEFTLNKMDPDGGKASDELCAIKLRCYMSSQGKHILAKQLLDLGDCFVLGEDATK